MVQIFLTVVTLLFAFFYTKYDWPGFQLKNNFWYCFCGLVLGFLASLLGIGGGPINVSLLMLMFALPIKEATVYSICTIFFSQLAKIVTIAGTTGFGLYDLKILWFVIPSRDCWRFVRGKSQHCPLTTKSDAGLPDSHPLGANHQSL